ncbi:hypothetical protein BGX30_001675, partial [Mortierella sp. GBA39]
MFTRTAGIHHITAFSRNPQETIDFYSGILGLSLVKKTVNFDDPTVYHLYFADPAGSPGTILTFFPYPRARQGQIGGGQVGIVTFVIPPGSIDFWQERLAWFGRDAASSKRFGESYLQFSDPDGLRLELAIKGLGGAVLLSEAYFDTIDVLENLLGLAKIGEDDGYARFQATAELGNLIDVRMENMEAGHGTAGTVHHIAWRASDNAEHEAWRERVSVNGFDVTPIKDRQYFNAIYFREHGGILFEIATDPPGFARDEAPDALGRKLMLPEWFEPQRGDIEARLEPVTTEK